MRTQESVDHVWRILLTHYLGSHAGKRRTGMDYYMILFGFIPVGLVL